MKKIYTILLLLLIIISCNENKNNEPISTAVNIANEAKIIVDEKQNNSKNEDLAQKIEEEFGIVISDNLHVRDGIGLDSSIIGKIHSGTIFKIIVKSEDRHKIDKYIDWWYKVEIQNGEKLKGWIYGAFTDVVLWPEQANELLNNQTWGKLGNIHQIKDLIEDDWGTPQDFPWIVKFFNNGIFRGIKIGPGSPRSYGFWRTISEKGIELKYISSTSESIIESIQLNGIWKTTENNDVFISKYTLEKEGSQIRIVNFSKSRKPGEKFIYNVFEVEIVNFSLYKTQKPTIVYSNPKDLVVSKIWFNGYHECDFIPSGKHVLSLGRYLDKNNTYYLVDLRLNPYHNKGEYLGFINSNDLVVLNANNGEWT